MRKLTVLSRALAVVFAFDCYGTMARTIDFINKLPTEQQATAQIYVETWSNRYCVVYKLSQ